ncbi:uncharacterized protein HMPREF1541_06158 [Cyphellophora europaea CBS 101466]|uniref:Riboflavin kinase n=1 Tax=Cyphellophora europaea (strain CBS 101466) TaxID=1220924 RepID=W2RTW2_CYPE1|nr:uncharacterized protein HMPREF1541_06158 [Cyphellophora europaea CBS 101466]ETN39931.1 hypothetical protein HMPREF1541_06158 [Cyphellophora europaea CBS 101466]
MPEIRPDKPRDDFAGPESGPEPPFPIKLSGPVIKGFGRGSRELGIPTANIPPSNLSSYPDLKSGVYYGFVGLKLTPETTQPADNSKLTLSSSASTNGVGVYPAVLSIGYNPYYKNKTRSIEIHLLHHFPRHNFYHTPLNLLILGFIRPEYDYASLDALVSDIKTDCDVARRSLLEREGYRRFMGDRALREFGWWEDGDGDVGRLEREVVGGEVKGEGEGEGGGQGDGKL